MYENDNLTITHLHSHGDSEIRNFIIVWLSAIASISYCYYVVSRIKTPILRLLSLIPIFILFILLPFSLRSIHLSAPTIFYLVWLGNFKLILFAFDLPPLSSSLSFSHFMSIALFPIKPYQKSKTETLASSSNSNGLATNSTGVDQVELHKRGSVLATKVVILAMVIQAYTYREYIHPSLIYVLFSLHVYLGVELLLALTAAPIRALLGLEIESQFNEPYLATSLQNFWGNRWNLMVTSILRPTVYNPTRRILGRFGAVFATFLVSGLMHELIYFYLTRVNPTWEVTGFFVLHGVCTAAEVAIKRVVGDKWRLHRAVSGPLTLAFVVVTAVWLFFPQIVRNGVDEKAIREYGMVIDFVKEKFMFYFNMPITQ